VRLLQDRTQEPASSADPSLFSGVNSLTAKLQSLPPPPTSVWKELVLQLQVCCW
jgi:hypothetical protein